MFVDAGIGQMVAELKKQGLLESTLIIITAKHGQSVPSIPTASRSLAKVSPPRRPM